ncbi:MAG: hypothetical protein JWM13_310 [Arthrobacter sp.]|nr:hypothetical protein [Arthrobacter sp.]MCU1552824.1 hypothetical protein [Arthrobacter sp.]
MAEVIQLPLCGGVQHRVAVAWVTDHHEDKASTTWCHAPSSPRSRTPSAASTSHSGSSGEVGA